MTNSFDDDVDTWTLAAVRAGPTSFDDLICHLPGVYPTDARASLDRLLARSRISEAEQRRALRRHQRAASPRPSSVLPVPHPLDFDWRFASEAVDALMGACSRFDGPDGSVVCIGAPSLHERLATTGVQPSILIDANDEVIAAVASITDDCAIHSRIGCDPLPALAARTVVIDPPWYPEHVRLFLWAAAQLCADGGTVLLSFPPAGTRPGVADEREDSLTFADGVGLSLHEIRRGELAYLSPPFERLALMAAGYGDLPADWRRGDLLVFRARPNRPITRRPEPVTDDVAWMAIQVPSTRIKVRIDRARVASAPVASSLQSVVDGDILPSVSRRDPRRSQVSVWTACNRVFRCDDTTVLAAIANALTARTDPVDAVASTLGRGLAPEEVANVRSTQEQLDQLLASEMHDLKECSWYTGDT